MKMASQEDKEETGEGPKYREKLTRKKNKIKIFLDLRKNKANSITKQLANYKKVPAIYSDKETEGNSSNIHMYG